MTSTKPLVGFDRFVRYEWAQRALEITVQGEDPQTLFEWLLAQGLRQESARRTWHLLVNLWVRSSPQTGDLRARALALFPTLSLRERVVLHLGMAVAQFPLFQQTIKTIGLLGRLQSEFSKREIVLRILEGYSNQTTVRRATERIVQTLNAWDIIEGASRPGVYRMCEPMTVTSPLLIEWLFFAVMHTDNQHWRLLDLLRSPEIFPFKCSGTEVILHKSPLFSIQRDSFGTEIVVMDIA